MCDILLRDLNKVSRTIGLLVPKDKVDIRCKFRRYLIDECESQRRHILQQALKNLGVEMRQ